MAFVRPFRVKARWRKKSLLSSATFLYNVHFFETAAKNQFHSPGKKKREAGEKFLVGVDVLINLRGALHLHLRHPKNPQKRAESTDSIFVLSHTPFAKAPNRSHPGILSLFFRELFSKTGATFYVSKVISFSQLFIS